MQSIMARDGRSSCSRTFCSTERCPFPRSLSYLRRRVADRQHRLPADVITKLWIMLQMRYEAYMVGALPE